MNECAKCELWCWCSMVPDECIQEPVQIDEDKYSHYNSGWHEENIKDDV